MITIESGVPLPQTVLFQYETDSQFLQCWEFLDVCVTFFPICLWEEKERKRWEAALVCVDVIRKHLWQLIEWFRFAWVF